MLVAVKTQSVKPVTSVLEVVKPIPAVKQEQLKPETPKKVSKTKIQGTKPWTSEVDTRALMRDAHVAARLIAAMHGISYREALKQGLENVWEMARQGDYRKVGATQPSKSFLERVIEDWIPSRSEWDVQYLRRKLGASWKKYGETCKDTQMKLKNFFEYLEVKFPEVVPSDTLVDLLRGDTQEESPEDYEEIMYMLHGYDDYLEDAEMYQ